MPAHRPPGTVPSEQPDTAGRNGALAQTFGRAGIPVLPCLAAGPRAKQPLTLHGHHDATTASDTIGRWWARWPSALVGIPAGPGPGVWVLDIDGEAGRHSLTEMLARLNVETIADLTACVSRTPSGGLHLIFRLQPGERPRNRARDIGAGLDSRGVKANGASAGYFIAPGSMLPDGRRYTLIDSATLVPIALDVRNPFGAASPAPKALMYLATFNATERARLVASPELQSAIQQAEPSTWPAIWERHRADQHSMTHEVEPHSDERQGRYAAAILTRELDDLAAMPPDSGRNDAVFRLVCRVGRWVHHGLIERDQLTSGVLDACARNGLITASGRKAVLATIASALAKSAGDALPDLGDRP